MSEYGIITVSFYNSSERGVVVPYRLYSSLSDVCENKNRAMIDTGALVSNYRTLCAFTDPSRVRPIAVVKADAYGHGIPICVPALLDEGCDFFAVASLPEAMAVREAVAAKNAKADILIFGYTDPSNLPLLLRYDLIQTVFSFAYGKRLSDAAEANGARLRVHLAADTGMNRVGFCAHDAQSLDASCREIVSLWERGALCIEGLFSHLFCADETDERSVAATNRQIARFEALHQRLSQQGCPIAFRHLCNSAGIMTHPEAHFEGVRLGVALYGVSPIPNGPDLLPVMRLETCVAHLHTLLPGETVGYGGTFCADTPRLIATLPIGYADGFLRAYRDSEVTLYTERGCFRVRLVGRICMDQCMLDVTDTDAAVGDRVVLFGNQAEDSSRFADAAGTIAYEVLTSVSSRVPRCEDSKKNEKNTASPKK